MISSSQRPECRNHATVVSGRRDTVPSHHSSYPFSSIPEIEVTTEFSKKSEVLRRGRFLKGPIMMEDIARAARLPGQALTVFLAIHHRKDLTGNMEVTLPSGLLGQLGVTRDAKARALHTLEAEGLIHVVRSKGRTARIHLTLAEERAREK